MIVLNMHLNNNLSIIYERVALLSCSDPVNKRFDVLWISVYNIYHCLISPMFLWSQVDIPRVMVSAASLPNFNCRSHNPLPWCH